MKKYIDFKNFLNKSNILLFDGECRIAHYNYLQLTKILGQIGGADDSSEILVNKIKNNGENLLKIFVYSLAKNNIERINFILKKIDIEFKYT
jgi:hypothetical protein